MRVDMGECESTNINAKQRELMRIDTDGCKRMPFVKSGNELPNAIVRKNRKKCGMFWRFG